MLACSSNPHAQASAHGTYVWSKPVSQSNPASQSPVYSGGQCVVNNGTSSTPYPYTGTTTWYGGNDAYPNGKAVSVTCSGAITATFTWKPDPSNPNELPPTSVIVEQDCSVDCYLDGGTGSYATGLGRSGTGDDYLSDTLYSVKTNPGLSFSITPACSPSVTATSKATDGGCGASVSYSAAAYPVTITITGTTPVNGTQALTGQQLTATLNVPSGFSVYQPPGQTGYQWTITGNNGNKVFKNYDPTLPSNQLVPLAPADLTVASPSFYDRAAETVSATCAVTLLAPDGVTQIPVTVRSKDILVLKPTVTRWDIVGGWVQHYNSTTWGLAVNPNSTTADGMTWSNVNISVPSPFSGGQGSFVQTVTPDHEIFKDGSANPTTGANNKKAGLDSGFPYGPPAGYWTVPAAGGDVDGPNIVSGANFNGYQGYNKIYANDTFTTWVMYNPPAVGSQGTVWVPLKSYTWGFSCTVLWQNNSWVTTQAFPQNAAAVPSFAPSKTDDPPTWLLIQSNY